MVKHAIGWGAMNGVTSAMLAKAGYTGTIFAGNGLNTVIGSQISVTVYWMADWVFYKEWASCAWGHAGGVAVLKLIDEYKISPEEIEKVRVKAFEEAAALFQGFPKTTEEAQFSIRWPLACLILDRELGPNQMLEQRFSDPQVKTMFEKIEVVVDPAVNQLYEEMKEMDLRMHGAVEIILSDGRILDSGIVERGADRYCKEDLELKFRKLAVHVCSQETVDKLVNLVWNFEYIKNVRELTDLII
jgi:2-methylcitrate dehydratase PrpD